MRILAVTNLYPNPYQPLRATFNRQEFRALAKLHSLALISPIAWTDELALRRRSGARLPRNRRVQLDGVTVDHPRYLFTPKVLRAWYGHFYRFSVKSAFDRALAEFRPDLIYAHWAYPDGWAAVELGHAAATAGDSHLRANSPAIDRADPTASPRQDLEGHPRPSGSGPDIGAFETTVKTGAGMQPPQIVHT